MSTNLPVDLHRYCRDCRKVTGHYHLRLDRSQQCLTCKKITPRFDLRNRTWAGV